MEQKEIKSTQVSSYKDLIVWQKSIDLVVAIYKLTKKLPIEEKYALAGQMKRAAVSIPSNIAEGSRRSSRKDFRHFLLNAYGSGSELETQIIVAKRLDFATDSDCKEIDVLLNEVMRMLNTMIHKL